MKSALALLLVGMALIAYSMTLPAYKDAQMFQQRYEEMKAGDSTAYHALRDDWLTPKYRLQDYGISAFLLSGLFAMRRRISQMKTPRSMLLFVVAALLVPVLVAAAFVFDLLQAQHRGAFPHWADTLVIPLTGLPVLFLVVLIWSAAHLTFLAGVRRKVVPLRSALSRRSNPWLLFVAMTTSALITLLLAEGAYWYAIPGFLWLYLSLALAAARRAHHP